MRDAQPAWLQQAQDRLVPMGLNAWGIADGAPWTHVLPGCRAVVVVGSGGPALWTAFVDAVRVAPELATVPDPLDTFVRCAVDALPAAPNRRWVRCAGDADLHVDFRTLAVAAGLGHPSRLGLVLHPTFGPWLGLRAACFVTDALAPTGPLPAPRPCDGCTAPCAAACPVGAVQGRGPDRFDWQASAAFQATDPTCHGGCLARSACPVGAVHAYPPDAHRYHQHAASRRAVLTRRLGESGSTDA